MRIYYEKRRFKYPQRDKDSLREYIGDTPKTETRTSQSASPSLSRQEKETMRTKGICDHDVSSPMSSLGDMYGFTMNNEIDDQFEETGRTSVFNGYRACLSCGSVFHMGKKVLDKYGGIAELDGRPIDAKGVWRIWTLWTSEATERNRKWT